MLVACVFPTLARDDCTRDEHLVQVSFSENLELIEVIRGRGEREGGRKGERKGERLILPMTACGWNYIG